MRAVDSHGLVLVVIGLGVALIVAAWVLEFLS